MSIFNPEHDIVLALDAGAGFTPPKAARRLRQDLRHLPSLWGASEEPSVWGWDAAVVAELLKRGVPRDRMPSDEQLREIRRLSNRSLAVEMLSRLRTLPGTIGTSAALAISDIPWNGPIGCISVGLVDGEIVLNPNQEQRHKSDMATTVVATEKKVSSPRLNAKGSWTLPSNTRQHLRVGWSIADCRSSPPSTVPTRATSSCLKRKNLPSLLSMLISSSCARSLCSSSSSSPRASRASTLVPSASI